VDLVICTKLDRIGRSVQHLTALVGELEALGVDLVMIDQGIDTTTPTGRLTFHVLAALAEFERDLIRERTREGLKAAKRRGAVLGRPRVLEQAQIDRARRLSKGGRSIRAIAEMLEVSKSVVHRALV
jgi:DNA invertase Pin-like site-specific DNA recombinase